MAADANVIDMSDLNDLAPLAKQLNAASDNITQSLQTIQDKLNAFGLGVEAWVSEALIESGFRGDEDAAGGREYTAWELGYGRFGDGWALLVRQRRYVEGDHSTFDSYDEGRPSALLRASRELRVAAVPLIPQLIDALKAEAQRVLDRVQDAKKIADSLR